MGTERAELLEQGLVNGSRRLHISKPGRMCVHLNHGLHALGVTFPVLGAQHLRRDWLVVWPLGIHELQVLLGEDVLLVRLAFAHQIGGRMHLLAQLSCSRCAILCHDLFGSLDHF